MELAERSELPAGRPAATHRPEEPCLNYKLGAHLSVTQRNRRTGECTQKKKQGLLLFTTSGIHTLTDAIIHSAPPSSSCLKISCKKTTTLKKATCKSNKKENKAKKGVNVNKKQKTAHKNRSHRTVSSLNTQTVTSLQIKNVH